MMMKQLLAAAFLIVLSNGYSQVYNCDVRQIELSAYDYVLKNLDSVKKHNPNADITVQADVSSTGKLEKVVYFTGYKTKTQKEATVWNELDLHIKEIFSLCPDSHFYDAESKLSQSIFTIPLSQEKLAKAIGDVKRAPGYTAPGNGYKDIAKDSNYTLDIKKLTVGKNTIEPLQITGTMDEYNSKMIKLTPMYYMAFKVVKVPNSKTNYITYKLYEVKNYKEKIVNREGWRPLVNGKLHLSVKGKREALPGVNPDDKFEFIADILLH